MFCYQTSSSKKSRKCKEEPFWQTYNPKSQNRSNGQGLETTDLVTREEKKGKVPYEMTERLETGNTPDEFGMG